MTAEEIIAQTGDLPIIPEWARQLVNLLHHPAASPHEIAQTLRGDDVFSAELLRLCNSAQTGLEHLVNSVDEAILLQGVNTVYRMACTIGFGSPMGFAQPGQSIETNGLWSHSLSIGLGAEYLTASEAYGQFPPPVAYTAGLLHDIGKLALSRILTPKIRAVIRDVMTSESLSRVAAEKAVLGVDHAEVGACLLRKWELPAFIIEAVANHHAPVAQPEIQLSAVVYLSNCAAHLSGTGLGWDAYALLAHQSAAELLGLETEKVAEMIANVQGAIKGVNQFIHVA